MYSNFFRFHTNVYKFKLLIYNLQYEENITQKFDTKTTKPHNL